MTNPGGTQGRVSDVAAFGNCAYLGAFRDPVCERGGVHVMDTSDLANPVEVPEAFTPTSTGSYVGEGVQVIEIGDRDVLIHNNETCPGVRPADGTVGGINLWDVTDPTAPENLPMHVGDTDGGSNANTVHSMFAWNDERAGRTYVVLVDNEETTDLDIMDITDPTNPVMVNDTLDLVELFGVDQDSPANLTSIFAHDMTVVKTGSKYVINVGYRDGGYVLLDVTDPTDVRLIAESDDDELDEERLARDHEISPEGNAHQSELSPDRRVLIGTDEDFNPFRVIATIDSGRYAGTEYVAVQASDTPPIDDVRRTTGLMLLDQELSADPCTQAAAGTAQETTIRAVFDGWGYVRLFKTDVPRSPTKTEGSITQIDTYAVPESQDPAYATGLGDLSVHEVAMDPTERLAYLSYYAAGFRVVKYGDKGLQEVGSFIDEGGNNFWGVEVYERDGETYVLASDRDFGLYVLQYTP